MEVKEKMIGEIIDKFLITLIGIIMIVFSINFSFYGTTEGVGIEFNKFTGLIFLIGLMLLVYGWMYEFNFIKVFIN